MTYPTFKTYLRTLSSLLRRKAYWLVEESQDLALLCQDYSKALNLSHSERKSLLLAAYFKNLGALYINNYVLEREFRDHNQLVASLNTWFSESVSLAKDAGLPEVALILDQYHQRKIPDHKLARIFQVLNAWVACQQKKGWRKSMSEREALIILEQRARLRWSDPMVVRHFVHHCDQNGVTFRSSEASSGLAVKNS
jgi:response regulator RpfG family c-di-GMP phosphodiesterase